MKPLDLPNFETQARRLRYQALGIACRDHGCDYLMLGHHEDDHAETVMMRLASGHSSRGTLGVRLCTGIPECWGIHGVHRSGLLGAHSDPIKHRQERPQDPRLQLQAPEDSVPEHPVFERGGVLMLRPLISFSKKRLVDTCRANAVDWEEDATNEEPWRTPRNAVRKLFQSSKLPVALRKDSMLALSERNREHMDSQRSIANNMLNQCDISELDTRSGKLVVRLPKLALPEDAARSHTCKTRLRVSTALLLRQLAYRVSPQIYIAFGSTEPAVTSIYPELFDSDILENPMHQPTGFTTGGVQFERLLWRLSKHWTGLHPSTFENPIPGTGGLDPDCAWRLSRQPFSDQLPLIPIPPRKRVPKFVPVNDTKPPDTYPMPKSSLWSPWHLWDGRYWIRVMNRSTQHFVVRPLQRSDLHSIETMIGGYRYRALRELLAEAAPDKIRWTLPAIAEFDDSQPSLGRVLALPTLGPGGHLNVENKMGEKRLEWQIRYKNTDLSF